MEISAKSKRDNTFKILYEGIPKRPSRLEVIDFIIDKLLAGEHVTRIQMCSSTATVYVETETLEQAQKIVRENKGKHFITVDGTAHPIPIAMEDGATEMRLHELPPYVTEEEIRKEMACFGEIISVAETVYGPETKIAGIKTGIRQFISRTD
uniref:RRM domain-containing protein n=1 Tax=Anopheles farauti TaxID=69004 RepID=A0A182QYV7_9DIPT